MKLLDVERGHVLQCPIAGDATVPFGRPSMRCPSDNTYSAWRDLFTRWMNFNGTWHMWSACVSGHRGKDFQVQSSKIKVIAWPNALLRLRLTFGRSDWLGFHLVWVTCTCSRWAWLCVSHTPAVLAGRVQ